MRDIQYWSTDCNAFDSLRSYGTVCRRSKSIRGDRGCMANFSFLIFLVFKTPDSKTLFFKLSVEIESGSSYFLKYIEKILRT